MAPARPLTPPAGVRDMAEQFALYHRLPPAPTAATAAEHAR